MNRNRAVVLLYIVFLLLVCLKTYRSPQYNFDILPYMGIILQYDGKSAADLHSFVYGAAKSEIPASKYQLLIDTSHAYRTRMHRSPGEFVANFPYYEVKPAYNYGNYVFYYFGIPLTKSTILFSIIGYMAMGILVLAWLRKSLNIVWAVVFSTLVMVMPFILHAAGLSTPDAISAFFVLLAFYFLLQKENIRIATLLLLVSILFRLDNILPFLVIQTGTWLYRRKQHVHALRTFLVAVVSGLVVYFLVTFQVKSGGWDRLYFTSFFERMSSSYDDTNGFSWKEYFKIALSQVYTAVYHSHLAGFILVSTILLVLKNTNRRTRLFVFLLFIIICLRFILHPVVADRFYLPYYIVSLILLITAIAPCTKYGNKVAEPVSVTS